VKKALMRSAAGAILTGFALGLAGCTDESTSKTESEVKTPGGTSRVTEKTTVSKSGDNPPPVSPPSKNP
jgi:hypothetical protein